MKQFTYVIKDELGIHARPAGLLVKEAKKFASDIKIATAAKEANAKGVMGVMGLGAKHGEEITITATGEDEEAAIQALQEFVETNL